jgi:arylsulfatase A-like enzyme
VNADDAPVEQPAIAPTTPPNILCVHIDNLGMGELGCYGGGILRGAATTRLDRFASEGLQLLNFAPEAQCTPTRSALLTGRYAIRSGNSSVQLAGLPGGLVAWEQTMGDILSAAGYATAIYGKWHIGDEPGRYPTDHGFDEWRASRTATTSACGQTTRSTTRSVTPCRSSLRPVKAVRSRTSNN